MKKKLKTLNICLLTISDSRTKINDDSGNLLEKYVVENGHTLYQREIVKDNIYAIRFFFSTWILDKNIDIIISTGGTGLTGRDGTPEAAKVLFDKEITGFGELFRQLSYDAIKTSAIQSRALAGVANSTYLFCLPGSKSACKLAWEKILKFQLDFKNKPCNFIDLIPRLNEN